jgi:hypothetical protein
VTHDKAIRKDPRSLVALAEGGAQVVTLIGSWKHKDLAANFVNSIFVVERHLRREPAPCLLKLHMAEPHKRDRARAGTIEVYRTRQDIMDAVRDLVA